MTYTEKQLASNTLEAVQRYFANEEHRKEFEKYYFAKYGKNYEWRCDK